MQSGLDYVEEYDLGGRFRHIRDVIWAGKI